MTSRRTFIQGALVCASGICLPARANPALGTGGTRSLRLHNVWTKKDVTFLLGRNEVVSRQMHRELNRFLLDHHNGSVGSMDPSLIPYLLNIQELLELDDPTFVMLSAYRSKRTQQMLRKRGEPVASNSMHLKGRAIDVRIADLPMRTLRDAAVDLRKGGVGLYKRFVHLDTGPVRAW